MPEVIQIGIALKGKHLYSCRFEPFLFVTDEKQFRNEFRAVIKKKFEINYEIKTKK